MTKDEFLAFYEKCLTDQCTPEELHLLEEFKDDFELTNSKWLPEMGNRDEVRAQIYTRLQMQVNEPTSAYLRNIKWVAIAASILVFLSIGLLFVVKSKSQLPSNNKIAKLQLTSNRITPGGNKAILTLANGKKVDLDDSKKGLLSKQGTVVINKLSNGNLVYHADTVNKSANSITYNSISTPRGGQYQVTLSDGTKVWLNAASSLKYPTAFSGKERHVELTGEAYFEVAKNKDMPFKVSVNDMDVEVLGTHFNIMAYNDENAVETTLLEGSVKLNKHNNESILIPGQQGVLKNGKSIFTVHEVNVEDIIAWKNGFFSFDNENIHTIMRKISRWYDVDVAYSGNLAKQNFGGTVSRFKNMDELLKTLELTGTIHFNVEGRRVTVMP